MKTEKLILRISEFTKFNWNISLLYEQAQEQE